MLTLKQILMATRKGHSGNNEARRASPLLPLRALRKIPPEFLIRVKDTTIHANLKKLS